MRGCAGSIVRCWVPYLCKYGNCGNVNPCFVNCLLWRNLVVARLCFTHPRSKQHAER